MLLPDTPIESFASARSGTKSRGQGRNTTPRTLRWKVNPAIGPSKDVVQIQRTYNQVPRGTGRSLCSTQYVGSRESLHGSCGARSSSLRSPKQTARQPDPALPEVDFSRHPPARPCPCLPRSSQLRLGPHFRRLVQILALALKVIPDLLSCYPNDVRILDRAGHRDLLVEVAVHRVLDEFA